MREMLIHCAVHGRDVRAIITDEPVTDGQAPVADVDLVCLEVDALCAAGECAICREPLEVLDARLARSGLAPQAFRHLTGVCDGCGRTTEQLLSAGGYVTCTECGTTRDWQVAH